MLSIGEVMSLIVWVQFFRHTICTVLCWKLRYQTCWSNIFSSLFLPLLLLQLGSRWYLLPAARPVAVRLECRRPLVFSARRSERITPLLRELHWLRDPERVTLQLCVLAYRGAVFMEQRRRTLLQLSLDIGRRHSTSSAFCWQSHAGGTIHQTFNARWPCLPSGFDTCVEQPAIVCQECTIADYVPSRAEYRTFPVVVWQWLGDRDCTAQYNCCLPATTDCQRFCRFLLFFLVLFNFVWCPCNVWHDSVTLISTLLLTYTRIICMASA